MPGKAQEHPILLWGADVHTVSGEVIAGGQIHFAGGRVVVGNRRLMADEGVDVSALAAGRDELAASGRTAVLVAAEGRGAGVIALADAVRGTSAAAVATFHEMGVQAVRLSGANEGTARRIAGRLGTSWYAVYVESPKSGNQSDPEAMRRVEDHQQLATDLGARVVSLKEKNIADALIQFAKRENISHVVFGQSARSRLDIMLRGSVINRFLSEMRQSTVQVVPMEKGKK